MTNRTKRLKRLAMLEKNAERVAAQALATSLHSEAKNQQQLVELKRYRNEYAATLCASESGAMPAAQAQHIRTFMNQLDTIIATIEIKVGTLKKQRKEHQYRWTTQLQKSKAMDKIVTKKVAKDAQCVDAAREIEIDDRSARKISAD